VTADSGGRRHPGAEALALFSRGDLPWPQRWKTGRHVAYCELCEHEVSRFRFATEELKHEAETQTLTGFEAITDWTRLEREMLGNIGVGLAAARCIDHVGHHRPTGLRTAAAVAGLLLLFAAGWFTHVPREQNEHLVASLRQLMGASAAPRAAGSVLQTTPDGISVRARGATLTIMHPRSAVVSLSGESSVRARYVDEDSGEVTITSVYGQ